MLSISAASSGSDALKARRPAAREFDKLARTDGLRQTAILMNNLDPADIMRQVLGRDPHEGLPPLALGAGLAFQRRLL